MQIILISDHLARARSVSLSTRHLLASALVLFLMVCSATAAAYWLSLRYAANVPLPALHRLVLAAQETEAERSRAFVQQNLNAMAVKLGEMQAQLTRLDALGERLASLAGVRDIRLMEAPGLGGAAPTLMPPQNLSLGDFSEKLLELSRQLENRNDMLGVLESQLFEQAVKKKMIPTMMPVKAPYNASAYGRRVDPFTGQWAMHEGIDFLAQLYRRTSAKLYGICLRVLRDEAEAEEALQDAFVTIWNKARLYDPAKASALTWLSVLARNKAVDRVRLKRIPTSELAEAAEFPDDSPSAFEVLEAADDRARLMHCLEQLDERYRSLIRAAFVDGASYPELATREAVPLGTMKSWIRRSLQRLRGCLEQ